MLRSGLQFPLPPLGGRRGALRSILIHNFPRLASINEIIGID